MAVADGVISFAVEKIGEMILQEAAFLNRVSSRVQELHTELSRMRCFLRDAESRKGGSISIRNWVSEIRNIAYDAEDVLEIYALKEASEAKSCSSICGLRWKNPVTLHHIGSEIDGIAARLANLTVSLQTYGLKEILTDTERPAQINSVRQSYSFKIEQTVGLEEDATLLLTQLKRADCRVVSICGMPGLGKTTLARKVYHQCELETVFEFFIWVFVSQQWGKRNIWETLLYEVLRPDEKKWKEIQKLKDEGVGKLLQEQLRRKKCVVVLDDIWDNVWSVLSPAFPTEDGTSCSKFLITTRNKNLARGYIHEPKCLNPDDSWELFKKTALINFNQAGYRMDESMEKLGRDMVNHCRGLPLAIVVLGGLLSTKTTYDEWDTIHQSIKSYLKGEGLGIFQLLALSYDDLPYELKPCFLYLGILPEDSVISGARLINLWVAEGIINQPRVEWEGEEASEDIAYRYLTELAQRYMIIVAKRDPLGRIKKCQMHDLMREFCLFKSEEENYFRLVRLYGAQRSLNLSSSSDLLTGRVRRLSLHLNNFPGNVKALECEEYPPIRSILGFSLDRHSGLSQGLMENLVRSFKLLRILDLEKVKGFGIPQTIGRLIYLRLLNLNSAWVGDLPASIGNLIRLLTLRLDPFDSARTIPNFFPKLKRLRHLYLPSKPGSKTKRLEFADLTDLRTLVNFPTSNADIDDLIRLTNLRKLKIIISDQVSLNKFKAIFESRAITYNYLRDFSIVLSPRFEGEIVVENIKSSCPRLVRLKRNGEVVYQKTS